MRRNELAKLLDLLNLAGDLGGESLLEGLYMYMSECVCEWIEQREQAVLFSTYSRLGGVGPGASEGGLPERGSGHRRAKGGASSDGGHF